MREEERAAWVLVYICGAMNSNPSGWGTVEEDRSWEEGLTAHNILGWIPSSGCKGTRYLLVVVGVTEDHQWASSMH